MRFAAFLAGVVFVSGAAASPTNLVHAPPGLDLNEDNCYGAPIPPWGQNPHPGWYRGDHPHLFPDVPCIKGAICDILKSFPKGLHCPPPPPPGPPPPPTSGYTQTFSNLTGATQASDYLTYGLVDTVTECQAMCNSVTGCKFVNTYHDVNGKGGSTQLTCSLFSLCHYSSDADNTGGQSQPDGSVNYIIDSDGWCKD